MCLAAKLTGWAPGKPMLFRPRSWATSRRKLKAKSSGAMIALQAARRDAGSDMLGDTVETVETIQTIETVVTVETIEGRDQPITSRLSRKSGTRNRFVSEKPLGRFEEMHILSPFHGR